MLNAASKRLTHAAIALICACAFAACGDGDKTPAEATALLQQAQQACEAQNYAQALTLIDSLDHAYPKAVEARRQALSLMPKAKEGLCLQQIVAADSLLLAYQANIDQAEHLLEHVNDGRQVEGYWVGTDMRHKNLMATAGIEGRVDEEYEFYIIASLPGKKGIHRIGIGGVDSQAIPAGDERAMGAQTFFSPFTVEDIRDALAQPGAEGPLTATLYGANGNALHTFNLTAKQAQALRAAATFAKNKQELKETLIERERLERALQIARNQIAQTAPAQ